MSASTGGFLHPKAMWLERHGAFADDYSFALQLTTLGEKKESASRSI
jgi:hypothetical protein